mmetsp:Transcript_35718/g.114378  ORF Transcript_35718/g.114378 Transcript_35718/m.114378 type:complete len:560 (+) Transcript_35718:3708-5387(+)
MPAAMVAECSDPFAQENFAFYSEDNNLMLAVVSNFKGLFTTHSASASKITSRGSLSATSGEVPPACSEQKTELPNSPRLMPKSLRKPRSCTSSQLSAGSSASLGSGLTQKTWVGPTDDVVDPGEWRNLRWSSVESQMAEEITIRQPGILANVVKSKLFETVCAVVILLNCASTGMEAHQNATGELGLQGERFLKISEHIFAAFFVCECWIRFKVYGFKGFVPQTLEGRQNLADLVLVVCDCIIFTWIMPLLAYLFGFHSEAKFLRILTVLRATRLARLIRVFRRTAALRDARLLIQGLCDSSRTLFWVVVVIFFVTYTFSIFGVVIIVGQLEVELHRVDSEDDRMRIRNLLEILGGIDRMMFTLIQVLCQDSFTSIIREIMVFVPGSWVFFYAYIVVGCLVLLNLMAAIIVENALETSRNDTELKMHEKEQVQSMHFHELQELFIMMDTDKSGTVCWDEFMKSFEDSEMSRKWMMLDFHPEDCWELFTLLDVHQSGDIPIDHFFTSLRRSKNTATSRDIFWLQRRIDMMLRQMGGDTPSRPYSKTRGSIGLGPRNMSIP